MNRLSAVLLCLFSTAIFAVAQNSGSTQPNTSPGNDQGSSAYGNNTYSSGAHAQAPASRNASPTANDKGPGPGSGVAGNANPTASGSPNASHTSNPSTEGQGGNNTSTKPSTVNPGNGNSPSSAPPGSSGSNTGGPPRSESAPSPMAPRLTNAALRIAEAQKAEPNSQNPATPQANNGQSSATSGNATPRTLAQASVADDAALQGRIQQALQNEPSLAGSHVSVKVTSGTIELAGTAASGKDKVTAERIAESFDANRKFEDKLVVTGQSPAAPNPQQK